MMLHSRNLKSPPPTNNINSSADFEGKKKHKFDKLWIIFTSLRTFSLDIFQVKSTVEVREILSKQPYSPVSISKVALAVSYRFQRLFTTCHHTPNIPPKSSTMASITASRVPATENGTPANVASSHPYTCNTCQVAFRNSELQRGHMRTDWQ